ncbi:hypothetical protein Tco_1412341, partial [Tanacetum coccineum]
NDIFVSDNALGSTSNANDSNAWSPEFVTFMGPKDGSGTVGSSKKLECSDKLQDSLVKHQDSLVKHEDSVKKNSSDPSEKHKSLSHPQEVADSEIMSTSDAHFPPVRDVSIETLKSVEHQDQPVDINMVKYDDAKSIAEKPMDTNTDIRDQYIQNEESKYVHPSSTQRCPPTVPQRSAGNLTCSIKALV